MEHKPVLIEKIIEYITMAEKIDLVVDCTLGLGGYTERFLDKYPEIKVVGLDVDNDAIEVAQKRLSKYGNRFTFRSLNFRDLDQIKELEGLTPDVVVFDLGVSNMQLTVAERGFSYLNEGPLNMRMEGVISESLTAWDVINTYDTREMADIFRTYGEERYAWQIAKGIVKYRQLKGAINTTTDLTEAIRNILPAPVQRKMGKHPARRVFQALRIFVNDELENLERGLEGAISVIGEGGLIMVVSYHSLEDRIVKHTYRKWKNEKRGHILTKKPVLPSEEEIENNKKARSAKLRIFKKQESF